MGDMGKDIRSLKSVEHAVVIEEEKWVSEDDRVAKTWAQMSLHRFEVVRTRL